MERENPKLVGLQLWLKVFEVDEVGRLVGRSSTFVDGRLQKVGR